MTLPIPALPVLSTTVGWVTNKNEIAAALIQFLIMNPGNTSDTVEDLLVSFRKMSATDGHDRMLMCQRLQHAFPPVLQRYYPTDEVKCTFTPEDYDSVENSDRFGVRFNVLIREKGDTSFRPVVVTGVFVVTENDTIKVNFTHTT